MSGFSSPSPSPSPNFFFSNIPTPSTPNARSTPPNPFPNTPTTATTNNNNTSVTSSLLEDRPTKRRRIEIEPLDVQNKHSVQNIFFNMPPLTPTSPLTAPPAPFGRSTEPPPPAPISASVDADYSYMNNLDAMDLPPDLSAFLNLESDQSNMTENEIEAFVSFFTDNTQKPDPAPMFTTMSVDNDLINGTPSIVVKKLTELTKNLDKYKTQLDHIRYEQKQMLSPPTAGEFEKLNFDQQAMIRDCAIAQQELHHILQAALLSPIHLFQLYTLEHELTLLSIRLSLYHDELLHLRSHPTTNKCFATLIVKKQPFPKSIKQHTKSTSSAIEDTTVVELIKAPKAECRPVGLVRAGFLQDEPQPKKGKRSSFTIQNDTQTMDDHGLVKFPDLRFPQGTRLKMVRLQFAVEVQYVQSNGQTAKQLLESNSTSPFVVMTNENQWESSAAVLLEFDIFERNPAGEVPWFKFANVLQNHYLRATRQDLADPKRPLSKFDLDYIHRYNFNSKPNINLNDFKQFWEWFGKVLHTIRHQKPFIFLWLQGLIYGFISKPEAERLLHNQPSGTFVARFSERRPGQIAIAFSKKDNISQRVGIHHYLFDSKTNNKTLPDFLKDNDKLIYLPQLKTQFLSTDGCVERVVHKDEVLREFYSKPKWNPLDGYEDGI